MGPRQGESSGSRIDQGGAASSSRAPVRQSIEHDEDGFPLLSVEDVVRRAKQDALETYRQKLLVSESTVRANAMIVNLERVLLERTDQGTTNEQDEVQVEGARLKLERALGNNDEKDLLEVEASIETLTLRMDALYLEKEDERRQKRLLRIDEENAGWMSNPSSKFIRLMKGDTKGELVITREERRSCMAKAAWTFALSGLVIAIVFLVVDFYTAQTNPALLTNVVEEESISLPLLTFCMGFPNIGAFHNPSDTGIRGGSLFAITTFENRESQLVLNTTESHRLQFEPVALGPAGCESRLGTFSRSDMTLNDDNDEEDNEQDDDGDEEEVSARKRKRTSSRFRKRLTRQLQLSQTQQSSADVLQSCYSCFRTRQDSLVSLQASKATEIGALPVSVTLARSKTLDYCFNGRIHFEDSAIRNALVEALESEEEGLAAAGVLKANVTSVLSGLRLITESFPSGSSQEEVAATIERNVAFLCNVYFFSGYFFPVEDDIDVRYTLARPEIGESLIWYQSGSGPYHFVDYFDSSFEVEEFTMREELQSARPWTFGTRTRVIVLANAPESTTPSVDDHATTLSDREAKSLHFARNVEYGTPTYLRRTNQEKQLILFESATFARFSVDVGLSRFQTYVSTRRPTTSVAEFLTDVFEYVGLFTGVCAYSVLVAPARVYLRRAVRRQPPGVDVP